MRESSKDKDFTRPEGIGPEVEAYDERTFFESFYNANASEQPKDWMTIGQISEPEARFHYNVTENSIIRGLARISPPPSAVMTRTWRLLEQRQSRRLLDIGSGTGHWIDFMRDVYFVKQCVGVEITEKMSAFLESKYADNPAVRIVSMDVSSDNFIADLSEATFDYITAIGVMFHIVDDAKWRLAMRNLAKLLKPGGLMIVGGEFGVATRDVQFHGQDEFKDWKEFQSHLKENQGKSMRVNKRVRSLADWQELVASTSLRLVDLVRSDSDPLLTVPENDVLILSRPE